MKAGVYMNTGPVSTDSERLMALRQKLRPPSRAASASALTRPWKM